LQRLRDLADDDMIFQISDRHSFSLFLGMKSFPGVFSGMKIVSYMYAAFQQFMPGADVGIDLSREYAAVKGG
jgi:hypothetical protein